MESLKLSFEAIAPIFLMMLLGYCLKKLRFADKQNFDVINNIVFKIFLPLLLFYNIYKTETANIVDTKLIIFLIAAILSVFILGYFAALKITPQNSKRGVILQGIFRSNYAILGIPLVGYVCGPGSGAVSSLMVAVIVPVFNVLAVVALERFRGKDTKLNILKLFKGVITNPLIIGSITGLVFFLLDIKLPDVIEKSVKDVSALSTPLALIVLGANFEFSGIKGYAKEIITVVLARLVIVPLMIVPVAIILDFTGEALACILITFASPIAVSSYAMAKQMNGDETLAGQAVVITSALCLLTLFLWIFAISSLGYF